MMIQHKTGLIVKLTSICMTVVTAAIMVTAQDGQRSRSITSEDFVKERPAAKAKTPKPKPLSYRSIRSDRNPIKRKPPTVKPRPQKAKPVITEIGVTVWKLRPPAEGENGYFFSVDDGNDERVRWLAERVNPDAVFAPRDPLRFAVESSVPGFLYVIGRETYSDGTFGTPYPIFPTEPDDDNSVRPGMLFDFPDQREDVAYLRLNPKKDNYTGEIMTIIIAAKPLTIIKLDKDGNVRDSDELRDLELGAQVELFTRTDTADRIYSTAESKAACGVKARKLERDKKACGTNGLTREESLPQSIYQVKAAAGQPAVAFVKLAVRQ